jgi:DNA mismatch repair protein MutS2
MIRKYEVLNKEISQSKEKIIDAARDEARTLIEQSNRLIEKTIREIRESQADKERTKKARAKLAVDSLQLTARPENSGVDSDKNLGKKVKPKRKVKELKEDTRNAGNKTPGGKSRSGKQLRVGDSVKMKGQKVPGEITEIKGKIATVAFEHITIKADIDRLFAIEREIGKITTGVAGKSQNRIIHEINARMANFKLSIDIRGKRAEETENEIRKYIDEAILLNIPEITILHGKGDGVLREVVRDLLKRIPEVKHYEDEHIERGGHGITIVKF